MDFPAGNPKVITSEDFPHLGGNYRWGDPNTHSPKAWDYIIDRFCIKSVLDLGSGTGHAAHYFSTKGLNVIAVDGLQENIDKSVFPTIGLDLTRQHVNTNVDLVHCQELVEHVEERFVDNIINSFKSGKYVCMTHGLPGQGGHHHVNEQPPEYWINLMQLNGFSYLHVDTARMRVLAGFEDAKCLHKTGLLWFNRRR